MITSTSSVNGERGAALLLAVFLLSLLLPVSLFFAVTAERAVELRKVLEQTARAQRAVTLRLRSAYRISRTADREIVYEGVEIERQPLGSTEVLSLSAVERNGYALAKKTLLALSALPPTCVFPDWEKLLEGAIPGCSFEAETRTLRQTSGYPKRCLAVRSGEMPLLIRGDLVLSKLGAPQTLVVLGDVEIGSFELTNDAAATLFALGKITIRELQAGTGAGRVFIASAQGSVEIGAIEGGTLCDLSAGKKAYRTTLARISAQSPMSVIIEGKERFGSAGCPPDLDPRVWKKTKLLAVEKSW